MNTTARIGGFAVLLVAVFLGALAAGDAFGPEHAATTPSMEEMEPMSAMSDSHDGSMSPMEHGESEAPAVRGLTISEGGLSLELATPPPATGQETPLRFRIASDDGSTVTDFDVEHTKRMHLIVVRRDLAGFQHLHPEQDAGGSWGVPLTLADPGTYRIFADFSHDGDAYTLAADLQVDGSVDSRPLPPASPVSAVDGFDVALAGGSVAPGEEANLTFTVTRNGEAVPVEDYLGAMGHLVALREGDLAFLHVHPDEDSLRFMATFPSPGTYRLFLQFQVEGRVHTAPFTLEVGR